MACGAPEHEAPNLLAPLIGDNFDTFFTRQPHSEVEIEQACRAASVCCVNAVRYAGRDRSIIRRVGNSSAASDHVIAWWGGVVSSFPPPRWWETWRRPAAA
jgi:hypothetical protein